MDLRDLEWKSLQYRKRLLSVIRRAGAGHIGGDLSCLDILNVLYNHVLRVSPDRVADPDRDRYVQSKGHAVEALYVVLADRGFFPDSELDALCRYGSPFIGHPTRKTPGIEHNTGALGHGLSVGVGMALAAKLDNRPYRVFVLMGDGELAEGSIWEACQSAAHYRLDNLIAIVDRNDLQISGPTESVMALEPLADKFRAFGLAVREVDGNYLPALVEAFESVPFTPGKPSLLLAHTTKGKGISFMERRADWHHHVPDTTEYEAALRELTQAEREWQAHYGVA